MTRLVNRLLLVWLALSVVTVIYLWLDHAARHAASTAVSVSAIGLGLAKVRLIMGEFMEVRTAPWQLRRLADLWIAIMAAVLLTAYYAGK